MLTRIKSRVAAVSLMAVVLALGALPAFAQETGVEAEIASALGDLQTIVLGVIGAFFALVIVGVAIRLGSKYVRRGGSQA
jgi:type IV secretory pathway VirB2 component (pilin)